MTKGLRILTHLILATRVGVPAAFGFRPRSDSVCLIQIMVLARRTLKAVYRKWLNLRFHNGAASMPPMLVIDIRWQAGSLLEPQ